VNYRADAARAGEVVAAIHADGGTAIAVQADVSRESEVVRLFEAVDSTFGRIDVLVNNAGIVEQPARVDEMSEARLLQMFAVNVFGSFFCAREAIRRMSTLRGGSGGAIVNVSSVASRIGSAGEYVDYAASKAAIDTFTLGLAREVAAEGVRVNAVRPGIIETEIHARRGDPGRIERLRANLPMHRAGSAEEVAFAILWLASKEAAYVTGSLLDVAGGR
jgi:NAD(P)-dependent dehydrogenase (short-subunit alcohol dehydrogenase family)